MKLTYHRNGDYLLPDLGLTEAKQRPLGKYGRMRLHYLEEHRPGLYTRLLLSGKLMEHLQEIDSTCQERLEQLTRQMQAQIIQGNMCLCLFMQIILSLQGSAHETAFRIWRQLWRICSELSAIYAAKALRSA